MELVSLKSDFAFKALFEDEQVRIWFISDVTGIPLASIRSARLAPVSLVKWWRNQKGGLLDVLVLLNDNTKIDIEMQIRPQKFWIKRQLYYLTRAYSDDLGMGQSYDRLKKCIIISILDFNLSDDAEYHSRYTLMDSNNREHTDLLEVHVIELRKTLAEGNPVNDWIRLFNAETEEDLTRMNTENKGVIKGMEIMRTLSLSKRIRYMFEQHLKEKRDRLAEDEYVRDMGKLEGKLEGEVSGKIESLITILRTRWNVSDAVIQEVRNIHSKEKLDELIAKAVIADTLEGFCKYLAG